MIHKSFNKGATQTAYKNSGVAENGIVYLQRYLFISERFCAHFKINDFFGKKDFLQ